MMMNFKKNQNNAVCSMDCKNCPNGAYKDSKLCVGCPAIYLAH